VRTPGNIKVNTSLDNHKEAIEQLCHQYGVRRLEVFGSMARGNAVAGKSDVDLLVSFQPSTPTQHADRYFGLLAALQDEFHCPIDLLEIGALRNPYFMRAIEEQRTLLYAG
jgi:predicted nucleotidyltransferase